MQSQHLESEILAEPTDPQPLPAQSTDGAVGDSTIEELDLDDLLNYQSVPPRHVVSISVLYRHIGRGRPLPYLLQDGEE